MIKIPYLKQESLVKTHSFNGLWTSRVHVGKYTIPMDGLVNGCFKLP